MRLYQFSKKELVEAYKKMLLSRKLDEKMMIMLRQGKSFFHIASSGHEAAQIAASLALEPGLDWCFPYYRDGSFCIGMGMTPEDIMLGFLARANDPSSGGRQLPQHFSHKDLRIVSQSSVTGTQYLQAVGCAQANQWNQSKEIVYVSSGEGTTSQGEFHEALNWASRKKLGILFHIQDNGYAISVPVADQTAGGSVYAMVAGYKNLARHDVDGTDLFESHLAFKKAEERARKGKGPTVIVSNVVRLTPHSSSDDHRKYRDQKELEEERGKDPILKLRQECLEAKLISQNEFDKLDQVCDELVEKAADWAEKQAHPDPQSVSTFLFSGTLVDGKENFNTLNDKIVMVDAINHALREELSINEKLVIYGQDVADPKGGVFTATKGLSSRFGTDRVFNGPLAEASIIGTAIGMSIQGYKPVVEIQFGDYIWTAMMQIRNELATLRYRSNNVWSCPLVIRVPVGGYIHGGLCHSQSIDGYFLHLPGIYIAYPSNAADAKGLLKMACRMNDPVLFLEHKGLYRQGYAAAPEPDEDYLLSFGKAKIIREGEDLTVITWGAMVQKSKEAVDKIQDENLSIEIIDIRTLVPLDMETIVKSIDKTGKVLIVHEDNLTGGPGAEIAAQISEMCFEMLDGPIHRVGAKDLPVPFNWYLEEQVLPQTSDIYEALVNLLEY